MYNTDSKTISNGLVLTILSVGTVLLGFGLFTKSALAAAPTFDPSTHYTVGTAPTSVTTGDFNKDGKLDLAVSNDISNNVSILLGVGNGTFGAKTSYTAGSFPTSVITADFNKDGNLDLAVANDTSDNVTILLGVGNGTFGAKTNYASGNGPTSVVTGDFNKDNKLDLAVANEYSDKVSILLGTGTGTFLAKTDYAVGYNPFSVATEDFNKDGKLDLAVANNDSDDISILLGTGTGTFGAQTNYAVGAFPVSITTDDFNADGKIDLVIANEYTSTVSVLLGAGNGTFYPKMDYSTGTKPSSVTTGDFNADSIVDLAVTNNNSDKVSLLLGVGDGTFNQKTDYTVGAHPTSVTTGDFNADGKTDLASTNTLANDVSILINTTFNTAKPTVITLKPKSGGIAIKVGKVTKTIRPFGSFYKGTIWARQVKFSGTHSHYVFLNSGDYVNGMIRVYDEQGLFVQTVKPFGLMATRGMNADMISQTSNGKVFLAVAFKKIGYSVRVYQITQKSGLVAVANVAESTKKTPGTILVSFLKLYGNDYGLTSMKSGSASTLKVWKYSSLKKTWARDSNKSTLSKLKVVLNEVVLK